MEQILITYYANNAKKLHKIVDKILFKFGGLSDKDLDDFYSLANEVFVDVMNRYDESRSFDGFLYSCLSNKIMSEITKRNREKRKADRTSISIDTPIGDDDERCTIGDMIADDFTIEKELFEKNEEEEWRKEVNEYLNSLSPLQRKIAFLLSDNNTPSEICEELHITIKHFENSMKRILADERIKLLRPLVERM
jgi:RNA polymerase sigma factor (sigma-70 family)